MIIIGISGNILTYSAAYLEIGRGRALVQVNNMIMLRGVLEAILPEDMLEWGEDGFGCRIQILGACV